MGGGGGLERAIPARLTASEGRRFAFPVGIAFLALGGVSWWRGHHVIAPGLATVAGLLLVAGFIVPARLGPIYRAWMGLAHAISKVTTPVFMGVTYFVILTPIGLLMRLFGRNPIVRESKDGSFLVRRPGGLKRRSDLTRQF
jgi:Saxitoxin biosynthesis operon protein SxtJ